LKSNRNLHETRFPVYGKAKLAAWLLMIHIVLGAVVAAPAQVAAAPVPLSQGKRPVTVADAVAMSQNGDRIQAGRYAAQGDVGHFSPDGSKFYVITEKGNLANDTTEFSLLVFKTADAFNSPVPLAVVTMATSSNDPAISSVSWLEDNETLVFLGESPRGDRQLYKVSCRTRRLEQLTNHPARIVSYSINPAGDRFVFMARVEVPPVISGEMRRRGFAVTSQSWIDIYGNGPPAFDSREELYFQSSRMKTPQLIGGVLDASDEPEQLDLQLSPNGRYALFQGYVIDSPPSWQEYDQALFPPSARRNCKTGEAYACPNQYLLADIQKGEIAPLLQSPVLFNFSPIRSTELATWTLNNSVLLINALLPLEPKSGPERKERSENVFAAEIRLPEKQLLPIESRRVPRAAASITHNATRDRFVISPYVVTDGPQVEFLYEADHWKVAENVSPEGKSSGGILVTVDEDSNHPPVLVATAPGTKQKSKLLDLNPQFSNLVFGRVETFEWQAHGGTPHGMIGLLYYPPDYSPGKRYPLIIQTHGFSKERFWIIGPYNTGYAAQPLAAKGFIVLQLDMGGNDLKLAFEVVDTAREGPEEMAAYESAIAALSEKGLIDPQRVGISGFSRTVYHTLYTLTHSEVRIGAATISDGVTFGYAGCLFYLSREDQSLCEKVNSANGPPFGEELVRWKESAPTFRLDRVQAPLLLQAISGPLGEWEIFAGLKWLSKPVELINFYPTGEHSLIRPSQRLLSEQTTVDWYCFWLKNEEDPDPAKAEQYKRWRGLRMLQEKAKNAH